MYLSFSIDTAPQWILRKRSKEDWSLRASRDGHSSSSSISPTLLVFRHLLQVQRSAVLWTLSIWLIWSFEWGLQMGAAYSSLGRTKVLYATYLVLLGAKAKFLRRKPSVLVALEEISETCWPQSMLSVMVITRYFADWTFSFLLFMFHIYLCYAVLFLTACDNMLGKGWPLGSLVCCVFLYFVTFPYRVPGQLWYLIVSIPDLYLPL